MRKILPGLGLLITVALTSPRAAEAHGSPSMGGFGFGFHEGAPPLVYAPPPPVYYGPYYPRPEYRRPYCEDHWRHRRYGPDWDDDSSDDD